MDELGVDVLLLSVGADLPYLTGYEAMPLERLTMLVLPARRRRAPRRARASKRRGSSPQPDLFEIVPWEETDDPIALVAELVGPARVRAAIGDTTWARFVLDLQRALPHATFVRASRVLAPIRMVKDADEIAALRAAARRGRRDRGRDARAAVRRSQRARRAPRARRAHARARSRTVELRDRRRGRARGEPAPRADGRSRDRGRRHRAVRLRRHDAAATAPTSRACSTSGEPPAEVRDAYAVLVEAQEAGVRAATVGTPCAEVDAAARRVIAGAGLGELFVHRVGHGIGQEAHEDPYMVAGNDAAARGRSRVQRRARHLPRGPVRHAPRRHRRRDRRRPAPAQRRAARPRGRRLTGAVRMKLDGATFLLQWATGGLAFLWVTTRRREVSLGYGWLLRGVYGVMAIGAAALFATQELTAARSLALAASIGVVASRPRSRSSCRSCAGAAGVSGRVELRADRQARRRGDGRPRGRPRCPTRERLAEFPPALDLDRAGGRRARPARGGGVRGRSVPARRGCGCSSAPRSSAR